MHSLYADQERKKYLIEAIALDAASIPAAPAANKGAASPLLLPADASSPAVLRTGGGLASVLGVHRAESLSPVLQDGALGTTPPDGRGQTGTGPGAGAGTGHLKRSAAAAAAAVAVIAAVRTPTHHQQQNQHQQQQAEVGYITSASATHVDYRDRGPSTAGTVPAAAVQAGPAASPCPSTTSPPWQVTKRPRLGSHTGTTAPATAAATHPHTPGSKAAAAGGRITGAAAGAKTPPRSPSPRDEVQAGGKSAPASPGRQRKGAGAAGGGSRSQSESQMLGEMLVKQYESRVGDALLSPYLEKAASLAGLALPASPELVRNPCPALACLAARPRPLQSWPACSCTCCSPAGDSPGGPGGHSAAGSQHRTPAVPGAVAGLSQAKRLGRRLMLPISKGLKGMEAVMRDGDGDGWDAARHPASFLACQLQARLPISSVCTTCD